MGVDKRKCATESFKKNQEKRVQKRSETDLYIGKFGIILFMMKPINGFINPTKIIIILILARENSVATK